MGKTISAKLTDTEYLTIFELANNKNITISNLIKQSILSAKIESNEVLKEKQKKLLELNRIGNNLNQISRYCNSKKVVDNLVLEELIKIREELQKK